MSVTAPHRRANPSPLAFHLGAALVSYQGALTAAAAAAEPDFPWHPSLADQRPDTAPPSDEVARQTAVRLSAIARGLHAWHTHPWRRDLPEPPVIWSSGSVRLLDYGQCPEASAPHGPPVLVLPSLVNRAHILDLMPEHSLLRRLAAAGLRPLLLDWGSPGPEEARFGLADYLARRVLPAARAIGAPSLGLLGYCMGGTLAVATAQALGPGCSALGTIGAPWDFAAPEPGLRGQMLALARRDDGAALEGWLQALGLAFGLIPVEVLQLVFAAINPVQAAAKFRRFAALDPASAQARHFVAVEDWLAEGTPIAAPAAIDLLVDWHLRNSPGAGRWAPLDGPVRPASLRIPALCITGTRDTIAPGPSAAALPASLPLVRHLAIDTGHVGLIVGRRSDDEVSRPLAQFLLGARQ